MSPAGALCSFPAVQPFVAGLPATLLVTLSTSPLFVGLVGDAHGSTNSWLMTSPIARCNLAFWSVWELPFLFVRLALIRMTEHVSFS